MKTLTNYAAGLRRRIGRLHRDERGLEALQVVMIIAIAAIFLIAIKTQWETIKDWFNGLVDQVTGWEE